jgi:mRNA interferase RelE/StbE
VTGKYAVEYERSASKDLHRLDQQARARILRKIAALADNRRPPGVIRLSGKHDMWRIRVGGTDAGMSPKGTTLEPHELAP